MRSCSIHSCIACGKKLITEAQLCEFLQSHITKHKQDDERKQELCKKISTRLESQIKEYNDRELAEVRIADIPMEREEYEWFANHDSLIEECLATFRDRHVYQRAEYAGYRREF